MIDELTQAFIDQVVAKKRFEPKAQNTRYGHVVLNTPYRVYLTKSNAPRLVRLYLSPDEGASWIRFQHVLSRSFCQQVILPVDVSSAIKFIEKSVEAAAASAA